LPLSTPIMMSPTTSTRFNSPTKHHKYLNPLS
jgi:hypothetical protein